MRSGRVRFLAVGVVAVLALSACGGDDGDDGDDGDPTASPSETTTDDGVELTEPGTELALGETATFQWNPSQRLEGYVAITVERLDVVSIKEFRAFKLSEKEEKATPYYVSVHVENLGDTNLAGVRVPLYLNDGSEVLTPQVTIPSTFEPCPSQPLPDRFTSGKSADLCLVYLAPEGGELEAMALLSADMPSAITWTGEITKPEKPEKDKGKKGRKKRR
jgi:hypothetical protein